MIGGETKYKKKYKIVRVRGLFPVTPTRETHAADLYF